MTLLSRANNEFRTRNYDKARELYIRCLEYAGPIGKQVRFNLQLCNQKLIGYSAGPSGIFNMPVERLLAQDVYKAFHSLSFPDVKTTIFRHVNLIREKSHSEEALRCALICALYAPFNRDLLAYVYSLAEKNGMEASMLRAEAEERSLAKIVMLSADRNYWMLNRVKVAGEFSCLKNYWNGFDFMLQPHEVTRKNSNCRLESHSAKDQQCSWENSYLEPSSNHTVCFGTIFLNEQKYLGLNLIQHYELCDQWILVEGTCKGYPTRKVSDEGLSLDDSSDQVRLFPDRYGKLKLIQHGWTEADGEDAKSELRNRYMRLVNSDYCVVIDADEFYETDDFRNALSCFSNPKIYAVTLPQIHFWKDLNHFITGEYYDVGHTRFFRHIQGAKYIKNHNFPEVENTFIHERGRRKFHRRINQLENGSCALAEPACYHLGFAKDYDDMQDKTEYYVNRGEAKTRPETTRSRAGWFDGNLPEKCTVRSWGGVIPEVLTYEQGQ